METFPDISVATNIIHEQYGEQPAATVEVLGSGHWSKAFTFIDNGTAYVLRISEYLDDFLKDHAAAVFGYEQLPIPKVAAIGPCAAGWYAVSERCYGTFLDDLTAAEWERVVPQLLSALDALRAVTFQNGIHWADHTPIDTTTWRSWLRDSLVDTPDARGGGWTETLQAYPDIYGVFTEGLALFTQLVPSMPELRCLLHRDWLHGNVLANTTTGELTGIFDWGCSLAGDFIYDIAWFTFWAPWHPGLDTIDIRSRVVGHYAALNFDVRDFDQRLRCYELHIALEHLAYSAAIGRVDTLASLADATKRLL